MKEQVFLGLLAAWIVADLIILVFNVDNFWGVAKEVYQRSEGPMVIFFPLMMVLSPLVLPYILFWRLNKKLWGMEDNPYK